MLVAVVERRAHCVDANPRHQAREEDACETDHHCECACERLPRHNIAVANCEAGDEGEIKRIAERPTLSKANQQAKGNLNRQNRKEDRPGSVNGTAECHEEASLHT